MGVWRIIGSASLLMAQGAWAQTTQVDFRGYALGSSIDEFKERPAPPGYQGGETRAVCTDADQSQSWMMPTSDLVQAGVVGCGYVENIGGSVVRAGLPLTPLDHEATVEFYFHNRRLYRIETYMDSTVSASILEALTAKFGQPSSTREERFQTRSGAVFPQSIAVWRRGRLTVTMSTPDLTTQRMSVIYLDEGAAAEVERLARAARNPNAVM